MNKKFLLTGNILTLTQQRGRALEALDKIAGARSVPHPLPLSYETLQNIARVAAAEIRNQTREADEIGQIHD